MKKSILNLGKSLAKTEQKKINGGIQDRLCTYCGYSALNVRLCFIAGVGTVEEPCVPR